MNIVYRVSFPGQVKQVGPQTLEITLPTCVGRILDEDFCHELLRALGPMKSQRVIDELEDTARIEYLRAAMVFGDTNALRRQRMEHEPNDDMSKAY